MLGKLGEDARPLAGGHSLIPMMKLRLAVPTHLVDLRSVRELRGIRIDGADLVIGATTTQHELIADATLTAKLPLIRETALQIADPQVRYVGTIGGNVANGDPGNDMPAVMQCLGAAYQIAGPGGERRVPARDFYKGSFVTALAPGEIITAVRIPLPPAGQGYAYEKLKRKVGDYATAAAAVVLTMAQGRVGACSIALTNLAETPLWAEAAAKVVIGSALDAAALKSAAKAAEAIANPASDNRGPAAYRKKMAGVMVARALARARLRAA